MEYESVITEELREAFLARIHKESPSVYETFTGRRFSIFEQWNDFAIPLELERQRSDEGKNQALYDGMVVRYVMLGQKVVMLKCCMRPTESVVNEAKREMQNELDKIIEFERNFDVPRAVRFSGYNGESGQGQDSSGYKPSFGSDGGIPAKTLKSGAIPL